MQHHPIDPQKRNIILAYRFLTGAQVCDSEELAIGGLDNISAALFDDYDYAALGHLHEPQQVTRPEVRYAGSRSNIRSQRYISISLSQSSSCVKRAMSTSKPCCSHPARNAGSQRLLFRFDADAEM